MATELHHETDRGTSSEAPLATLVSGIIKDAQDLIKQEMALARREVAEEINKTKQAVISLSLGVGTAAIGGFFLLVTIVMVLHEVVHLPWWGSFLIVGGGLFLVGVFLIFLGKAKASDIHLVPPQTVETMKENVQWIKNQT